MDISPGDLIGTRSPENGGFIPRRSTKRAAARRKRKSLIREIRGAVHASKRLSHFDRRRIRFSPISSIEMPNEEREDSGIYSAVKL